MKISALVPFLLFNYPAPVSDLRVESSPEMPSPTLSGPYKDPRWPTHKVINLSLTESVKYPLPEIVYLSEQPGNPLFARMLGFLVWLGPTLDGLISYDQEPHIGPISQFFPAMLEQLVKFPLDYLFARYWGAQMICEDPEQMPPHPRSLVANHADLTNKNCYLTQGNAANQSETLVIDITGGGGLTASQHNARMLGAIAQKLPDATYWTPILELINPFKLSPARVTDRQGLQILSRLENHFRQSPNTKHLILSCNSFGCQIGASELSVCSISLTVCVTKSNQCKRFPSG